MLSSSQQDVLSQLHRYKRLLVFGGGVASTLMMLLAFALASLSTVREYLALERQTFIVGRTQVMDEINASEELFRSALVGAEQTWLEGERAAPGLVERYRKQGYELTYPLTLSHTPQHRLLFGMPNNSPSTDELRQYFGLAAQLGRVSAVNSLVRGRQATRYFYGAQRNIAGILTLPSSHQALTPGTPAERELLLAALGDGLDILSAIHAGRQLDQPRLVSWMPPAVSPLTGAMAIRIAAPAFHAGAPFAMLVTEYGPEILTSPLGEGGFDGTYMVVSDAGEVVASTAGPKVNPALIERMRTLGIEQTGEKARREIWRDGVFTISDRLGDTGWVLVYAVTWRDVFAGIGAQIGISALIIMTIVVVIWTLLIYFNRHIFRPVLERSRRVFESEHLSRTLVETAPVGLGLIAVQNGEPLLRSSAMIKATEQIAVPARTLSEELVRRYGPRSGASAEQGVTREEVTLPTREGGTVDLSVSVVPARYQGHDVLVTAFTDVTAERRLERQWREAKWAADKANAAKSAFLAAMSHEIRTPMNALMGNLELLSHTPLDALQQDRLKTIRSSSDGLLAIVSDVLDFSKIEAGEMTLERLVFDAQAVAARVLRMFEPVARAKGLRLWGEFGTSTTQPMHGDPTRLGQVMNNLLSNAIKFTERGEVTLRLSVPAGQGAQGSELVIEVEDSGIGMSAGQQALLFQAFSQADATISRRFGGTGLGLALCARLTEAMGGTIAVRSEPGEGSVFTVRVPQGECAGEPGVPGARFAGERVLFVAASPAWHAYAVAALDGWGLQVQAYRHPAQLDQAMLEEADTLILCGERNTWHADDEARLVEESSWVIDCSPEGPATPVATGRVVRVSGYGLKGLEAALRYTLQAEPLEVGHEAQGVLSRRLKVLVAEDNEVNRQLFEEQLKLLDCEVRSAQDGQEALACLSQERFDVLVTDLAMPVLDGYGLAREARARWPEMPIVAATASATLEERSRCEAAGITRVVTKPLQLDDLLTTLSEVSGVPRMAVEAAGPEGPRDGVLGGREVPEHVRAAFLHSCERSLGVLHAASRDADGAARVLAELHSLRGALAVFGYQALADRYADLEARIRQHGPASIGQLDFELNIQDFEPTGT
ncbi:two-component system, NarL family, capsular synthesis sensor histidine kinase RcsC [Paraburkholderia fungorum]|uniref:Sensory/regulatory protein RpfC n=1 Tax=Paraburkholderia fungorum TaxID=134537 RepID=A0A1H1H727_9BURK|nr:ATP-binding protein [Paraburkholderia fungorum]SDR21163.1 two-component system, NarL family, capsular synthesis sensor histidine kinase RcsC [Paraburkholderia fungorum]